MSSPHDSFFEELEEEIAFGLSGSEKTSNVSVSPEQKSPRTESRENMVESRENMVESRPARPSTMHNAPRNNHVRTPVEHARKPVHPRQESTRVAPSHQVRTKQTSARQDMPQNNTPRSSITLPDGKSVFLPALRTWAMRILPISSLKNRDDAMISYHYENDVLLVNSGTFFPEETSLDIKSMFADIRFLVPHKQKIRGLVLLRAPASAEALKQTLLHLGRPQVYAPQHVIVEIQKYLRNNDGFTASHFHVIDLSAKESVIGSFAISFLADADSPVATIVQTPAGRVFAECQKNDSATLVRFQGEMATSDVCLVYAVPTLSESKNFLCLGSHDPKKESRENITFVENGNLIDILPDHTVLVHDFKLHLDSFFFDGNGIGNESSHVLKARHQMKDSGVISIVFIVDKKTRSILGPIKLETRGLAYLHEAREIHRFIIKIGKASYEQTVTDVPDIEEKDLLKIIKKDLEKALSERLGRDPMIIPVVVEL